MQAAIGYLRVSTREQGRSGLGLARNDLKSKHSVRARDSRLSSGTKMCRPAPERTPCCCVQGSRRH